MQQPVEEPPQYGYEEWPRSDEQAQSYGDPYWQGDQTYGYGEVSVRGRGVEGNLRCRLRVS